MYTIRKFFKLFLILISFALAFSEANAAFLPPASGKTGMVVSAQHLAARVGVQILKQGGNAVDAAVAIGYTLAVVHPCCGNIGGGGFMLIHLAHGKNVLVDFRETAPAAISPKLFLDKKGEVVSQRVISSYLGVGVPGTVMGLNTALKKYGTMSLAKVIKPAIMFAKQGFILDSQSIHFLKLGENIFKKHANVAAIFLNHGEPYKVGQRLKQPQLTRTLTLISKFGSKAFYRGSIAREVVKASKKNGGVLSLADFKNYRAIIREPVTCNYRGFKVISTPPPGSGTVVCQILNIVSGYPLKKLGFHSALSAHLNIEAMRYAFYDRNHLLGDPAFVKNPLKKLLSPAYAAKIRSLISFYKAGDSSHINVKFNRNNHTTNFSVMDRFGNAVDATVTINSFFGSGLIAGKTGFLLNNELDDFTLKVGTPNKFGLIQGKVNLIAPNKRPLSSMSPTIILKNNKVYMLLGAAGGSTIITIIVEAIEHVIDYGMDINAAINEPRFHFQWLPNIVYMEPYTFSKDTLMKLHFMGYKTKHGSVYGTRLWGQASAILRDPKTGIIYGANDNRRPKGLAIAP